MDNISAQAYGAEKRHASPTDIFIPTGREIKTVAEKRILYMDLGRAENIKAFEESFYASFVDLTHNRLIHQLWEWEHSAKRLRLSLPYQNLKILLMVGRYGIVRAIAINHCVAQLQSSKFGFQIPDDLKEEAAAGRVCEFPAYFAVSETNTRNALLFWHTGFQDLFAQGYHTALATSAAKFLRYYQWMGAKVIGETIIDGEVRYFYRFDLSFIPSISVDAVKLDAS